MEILQIPSKEDKKEDSEKRIGVVLMYNPMTGEGSIKPSTEFIDNDLMLQVDCLRDWIYDLDVIHDKGVKLLANGDSIYSKDLFKEEYDVRKTK